MQVVGKKSPKARVPAEGNQIKEIAVPASAIPDVLEIVAVEYVSDCKLRLRFQNGREREVDFGPFLLSSQHPDIRRYLDKDLFQSYVLRHGNIDWNDYDLVFPIADLYKGSVE